MAGVGNRDIGRSMHRTIVPGNSITTITHRLILFISGTHRH
ncbi:hypothetical protein C7S16_6664 [Burkholderia thailandensis]|uniref:Uncharacterized protein n=1 Tax=Burkholderia thailandensis TaxID=57975 RepID=A0AAW9CMR3_BURTH|nr:hypothetical protein [Burkholderia thailandensis]